MAKKTPTQKRILWNIVRSVLTDKPTAADSEIREHVSSTFGEELPAWLLNEARYVYSQKVKRGEIAPPDGFVTQDTLRDTFMRACLQDRILFLEWAESKVNNSIHSS